MRKIRVVVVDDSLFMRAAVKRALETDGRFEVVAQGKDGRDAVDKILALVPDVVTMDFNMPRMDGVAAVREIMAPARRRSSCSRRTPPRGRARPSTPSPPGPWTS